MRLFSISIAAAALIGCKGQAAEQPDPSQGAALISAALTPLEGDHVWTMDAEKSALTFAASHNGDFTGNFSRFDAAIKLNPDTPEDGLIHAVVDLSSIDAGDSDRNANLPLAEWFDVSAFPTATFKSGEITKTETGYDTAGELTIKGIIQPATLSFTLDIQDGTAHALGQLELDRRDFNLGTGSDFANEDWVKFPVTVNIDITARQ